MQTEPVRAGLGKGRMLGAGCTSFTEPLMDARLSHTAPAPAAVIEDLLRRLSEEEARNMVLNQKYEEQQAINAGLKEEMVGLKSQLDNFMNMFEAYVRGVAGAAGFRCPVVLVSANVAVPRMR
ncbi:hypothetical protein LIER_14041 [Lithospermum erythrorhizon]|uniref:Uncharacterized protein n=1 Tax=Lithospermum erythrorhizon TaxID=34254 RepID=A0AAV3PZ75_LITER